MLDASGVPPLTVPLQLLLSWSQLAEPVSSALEMFLQTVVVFPGVVIVTDPVQCAFKLGVVQRGSYSGRVGADRSLSLGICMAR